MGHPEVHLSLPQHGGERIDLDESIRHAFAFINARLGAAPTLRFKVGITHMPVRRFESNNGAYRPLGYHRMDLLHVTDIVDEAVSMERALLARLRSNARCQNRSGGGETCSWFVPHFVYVVWLASVPENLIRQNIKSGSSSRGKRKFWGLWDDM